MAYIQLFDRSDTMIAVYLKGLDTSYGSNNRYADYYIAKNGSSVYTHAGGHSLPAGIASTINGGVCKFENLSPSTKYQVKVVISGISGSAISEKTLTKTLWTEDAAPEVEDFICIAESSRENDAFYATCLFNVSGVLEGTTTYEICARQSGTSQWYLKSEANGDIYYSSVTYNIAGTQAEGNIGVRLYDAEAFSKKYDIKLVVTTNDEVSEYIAENIEFIKNWVTEFYGYQDPPGEPSAFMEFSFYSDSSTYLPAKSYIFIYFYDENGEIVANPDGSVLYALDGEPARGCSGASANLDYGKYTAHLSLQIYETDDDGFDVFVKSDLAECGIEISANTPVIKSFTVQQSESGGKKVTCNISLSNVVVGVTKYEIYARQSGSTEWWSKSEASATLSATSFSTEVVLDSTGEYEFRLTVATDDQEAFAETSFTLVEMELWQWSKIYENSAGGTNLELSPTVYVPISGKELRPVTAEDWNNFTARINLKRTELNLSEYSFDTVETGQLFEPYIYNQAVTAIKGLGSGAGSFLSEIDENTVLSASLFTLLADELNAAILNL